MATFGNGRKCAGEPNVTRINDKQLEEIVSQHGSALVLFARQWCNWPDDALQEALCDLVQVTPIPLDTVAWLFKVVRCKALNLSRSEQRRDEHHRHAAEQQDQWFQVQPESSLDANELENVLSKLPELEREIVVARIWGELSFAQISEFTGKPQSTVHRHYQLAITHLKALIDMRAGDKPKSYRDLSSCPLEPKL